MPGFNSTTLRVPAPQLHLMWAYMSRLWTNLVVGDFLVYDKMFGIMKTVSVLFPPL